MEYGLGVVSGFFGTIVSHPFDTIRTCQAVDKRSARVIALELLRTDGLRGVYRGIFSPCLAVGFWKGAVLGTHHQLLSRFVRQRKVSGADMLPYVDVTCSACVSGALGATICSPFEMIKSRTQLGSGGEHSKVLARREFGVLAGLMRAQGLSGLARGMPLLFVRDCYATGFFLTPYEALRRKFVTDLGWSITASALMAGAIAGPIGWVCCYPIEITRILYQSDQKFTSYRQCVRQIYGEFGVAGFFRGLPTCCVRSSFQIACTMAMFEQLKKWLA